MTTLKIEDLIELLSVAPQVGATAKSLSDKKIKTLFLEGLTGSAAPVLFATMAQKNLLPNALFILNDEEEAGYFYHDLTQMLGNEQVLFFPSSYRRAIKYAQRDAANEILRTEVLSRCMMKDGRYLIVSYPEALAELVISRRQMDERTLSLEQGQNIDTSIIVTQLREFGFHEVDYVYEPGQFALRGSILDVYSFSCEYPFRIDFFGDDIDSIRTFDVTDQLSRDRRDRIQIVPELSVTSEERVRLARKAMGLNIINGYKIEPLNDEDYSNVRVQLLSSGKHPMYTTGICCLTKENLEKLKKKLNGIVEYQLDIRKQTRPLYGIEIIQMIS